VLLGTTPIALAIDSFTNRVYAVNHDSNNLNVIDGNAVVATIVLRRPPRTLAVNANSKRVYVTEGPASAPNRVNVFDSSYNNHVGASHSRSLA
jgi:YVTN family beta-propeller protein